VLLSVPSRHLEEESTGWKREQSWAERPVQAEIPVWEARLAVLPHQILMRLPSIAAWLEVWLELGPEEQEEEQEGRPVLGRQALMRPLAIPAWLAVWVEQFQEE
jgi:hypothetical protein